MENGGLGFKAIYSYIVSFKAILGSVRPSPKARQWSGEMAHCCTVLKSGVLGLSSYVTTPGCNPSMRKVEAEGALWLAGARSGRDPVSKEEVASDRGHLMPCPRVTVYTGAHTYTCKPDKQPPTKQS